jgi:hypothetical protein
VDHHQVVVLSGTILTHPFHILRIRWGHRWQPRGAGRDKEVGT